MSEFQKIAIGLLSMSHPEIYRSGSLAERRPTATLEPADLQSTRGSKSGPGAAALRALKFAIAALLAGSRAIPLGDNGRVTRELGEYGAHLKRC